MVLDWNKMTIDQHISYLRSKYNYSSSGDAKAIFELINAYEQLKKENLMDKQNQVIDAIIGERRYQDEMVDNTNRPDMIEDLHVGDIISAMEYNLSLARAAWYQGCAPHEGAMEYIRKICALGVQAGEKYGMPYREVISVDNFLHACKNDTLDGCVSENCKCRNK